MKISKQQAILNKLIEYGNTKKRAKEIIEEAENSSAPEFIYNYFNINLKTIK